MKINLWHGGEGWKLVECEIGSEELTRRKISIGDNVRLGYNVTSFDNVSLGYGDIFVTAGPAGSRCAMTAYNATIDKIWCGCYSGALNEFASRVADVYGKNHKYRKEYDAMIAYFGAIKKNAQTHEKSEGVTHD